MIGASKVQAPDACRNWFPGLVMAFKRLGVLDDAADVEECHFGQAGVAATGKQILAIFPDRLVHVHARTVVANDVASA